MGDYSLIAEGGVQSLGVEDVDGDVREVHQDGAHLTLVEAVVFWFVLEQILAQSRVEVRARVATS